jgi:hypothetical protein
MLASLATTARAHEAAGEPPRFVDPPCITVVDLTQVASLHVAYGLVLEDTQYSMGDIMMPDAKTHQFFVFSGALAPLGFDYELRRFDDPEGEAIPVPLWITVDDVKRAAQASGVLDGTNFTEGDVPEGAVLEDHSALSGLWQRVTLDDARVPITYTQAAMGVSWNLTGVSAGLYTFAGYVFTPPYNAWAPLPGLVKVKDAEHDPPAVVLQSIRTTLFSHQGLRVRGCADVPEGASVRAFFRVTERPEQGWLLWLDDTPLTTGPFEHCFHDPRPELTGTVQLRFDVASEDGSTLSFYTPDTLTALSGSSACEPSESVCCEGTARPSPCGDSGSCAAPSSGRDGSAPTPPAESLMDAGAGAPAKDRRGSGGCAVSVLPGSSPWLGGWLLPALVLARKTLWLQPVRRPAPRLASTRKRAPPLVPVPRKC